MFRFHASFIAIVHFNVCFSQTNLVSNPSFDILDSCPQQFSQLYFASPWFQPSKYFGNTTLSCSSDLFNECSYPSEDGVSVPLNSSGYQTAKSGSGYAGIYVCSPVGTPMGDQREYLEVPLISPLLSGSRYCLNFYVSLAETSGGAISNIGAYFSQDSLTDTTYLFLNRIPQVENPFTNMLLDTSNWTLISGDFVATGGEKFLTIGNFRSNANSNYQSVSSIYGPGVSIAYYFIDDVSLTICDQPVSVKETGKNSLLSLFPNPVNDRLVILVDSKEQEITYEINTVFGELLSSSPLNTDTYMIDVENLQNGIYFLTLRIGTEKFVKKFIKD